MRCAIAPTALTYCSSFMSGAVFFELISAQHGSDGFTAKLSETGRINVLIKSGLNNFWRKLKVFQKFLLGDMKHVDLDVFTEINAIHHGFQ